MSSIFRAIGVLGFLTLVLAWPTEARAQGALTNCKTPGQTQERTPLSEPVPGKPGVMKYTFIGSVQIDCDETHIFADKLEWTSDEDLVYASGNVVFQQQDMRIFAERAVFDRKTHLGTFYNASGSAQLAEKKPDPSLFGTLEPDVMFWGDRIDKVADRTYELTDGGFTTCAQPSPRWEMTSSTSRVTLDKYVIMKNVIFRVKDVPLLYLPIIYYPISHNDRSTGFLLPSYGTSTTRGFTLSNAFFWAIGRSQDATFFDDWFKKTGQGIGAEYRYISAPGSQGNTRLYVIDEHQLVAPDGTVTPPHRSYSFIGSVNQALPHGFRLISSANYFSDATTQQRYQQNLFDFTNRNRTVDATLTGGFGRYRLSADVQQNDVYSSLTTASRVGHEPVVDFSMGEKPIGHSHVYVGATSESGYFLRQDDISQPSTDHSLWRVDLSPTVRVPVSTPSFMTLTTSASWRYTYWSQSRDPATGNQLQVPITRELVDLRAQLVGPIFAKIIQTPDSDYAERFKHTIEPSVSVDYISPFSGFNNVVQSDGTDLVASTTTVNYTLTNRLLAKRKLAGGTTIRDILDVAIGQSYYTNSTAASYDQQYQSSFNNVYGTYVPSPFSPVLLTVTAKPLDSLDAQFRTEYDVKFRAIRTLTASGNLRTRTVQVGVSWSKNEYIPGLPGFDVQAAATHYLNASTTLRDPEGHLGGSFSFNYDLHNGAFLQKRVVAYYNTQCCGVSVDFQTVNLGSLLPAGTNDRRFGISFTLAGIGSFSNPMGSFGNNNGRQ